MKNFKKLVLFFAVLCTLGLASSSVAFADIDDQGPGVTPGSQSQVPATTGNCKPTFFGLKAWSYYLPKNADCTISKFEVLPESGNSGFILIVIAIIDDLLVVGGFVAVGFLIYAGVIYITSQGSPDQTQKAQQAIQNALIGLLVVLLAIAVVRFVGGRLT